MKKWLLCSFLSIFMLLTLSACSTDDTGGSSDAGSENSNQQNSAPESDVSNAEELNVEIISEELQKYTDIFDETCVTYVAELKNTGTKTVQINDVSVDIEKTDGTLLATQDYLLVFPNIIAPGESAYICEDVIQGLTAEDDTSSDELGNAILDFTLTECEPVEPLPVSFTEITLGESDGSPSVMGRITNNGDSELTDIYLAIVIRDANGKLQNAIVGGFDSLGAGETKGFEQSTLYGDMSLDFSASTVDVIAYL